MLQVLVVMLALLYGTDAKESMDNCDGDDGAVLGIETDHNFFICHHLGRSCIYHDGVLRVQAGVCITQYNSSNFTVAGLCPYFSANLLWSSLFVCYSYIQIKLAFESNNPTSLT